MQAVYRGFYLALRGASIDKPRAEGRLDAAKCGRGDKPAPILAAWLGNRPVSRTASRREAADALGVSPDFFDEHCTSAISSSSRSPSLSAGGSGGSIPVAVRFEPMLG